MAIYPPPCKAQHLVVAFAGKPSVRPQMDRGKIYGRWCVVPQEVAAQVQSIEGVVCEELCIKCECTSVLSHATWQHILQDCQATYQGLSFLRSPPVPQ